MYFIHCNLCTAVPMRAKTGHHWISRCVSATAEVVSGMEKNGDMKMVLAPVRPSSLFDSTTMTTASQDVSLLGPFDGRDSRRVTLIIAACHIDGRIDGLYFSLFRFFVLSAYCLSQISNETER